jgi:hypothetical protein
MEESDKAKAFDVLVEAFGLKMGTYDDMVAEVGQLRARVQEWAYIQRELASAKVAHPVYPHSVLDGVRHLITQRDVMQDFIGGMRKALGLEERPGSIGIDELRGVHNLKAACDRFKAQVVEYEAGEALQNLRNEVDTLRMRVDKLQEETRLRGGFPF